MAGPQQPMNQVTLDFVPVELNLVKINLRILPACGFPSVIHRIDFVRQEPLILDSFVIFQMNNEYFVVQGLDETIPS